MCATFLQDYSTRKVLERAVKGVTHDKYSISVAPPKLYAKRFLEFTTKNVFMSQTEFADVRQQQAAAGSSPGSAVQQAVLGADLAAVGVQQHTPWALPPIATGGVGVAAAAQEDEEYQDAVDGSNERGLPLATEDSFPVPPGQLGSASEVDFVSGSMAGASGEIPAVAPEESAGGAAAVDPPLLDLLAAPTGLDLTSPVGHTLSAGPDSTGRLISAEQVSVTVLEDGVVDGVETEVSSQAVCPVQDAVLVPAVVVERVPPVKQLSVEQQPCDDKVLAVGTGVQQQQQQQQGAPGVIIARG